MENANEAATPPLSVPSVDSQSVEGVGGGVRIPRRWEGGDAGGGSTGSTTESSIGSSMPLNHGPEDDVSVLSLASNRSAAAGIPTTSSTASTTSTTSTIVAAATNPLASTAVGGQTAPTRNTTGNNNTVDSERAAETDRGEQGLRDLNSTARGSIPSIPVVFATSHGLEAKNNSNSAKPSPRGKFGRAHRAVTTETRAAARRQFWAGVKPARANSMLPLPTGGGPPGLSMVTLRAAMKLKKKANVIQAKSVLNKYILNPRSLRMQYWKNWMLVNIMFTVLVTPWRISFQVPAREFGLVLAGIVNTSFIADTVLHFFTAVETESVLLTDRKEIARRYLKSWFFLDLVTCVPYTTLLRNVIPPSLRVMAPLRGLRLLKLLKVVKVYTLHYEVRELSRASVGHTAYTVVHRPSCLSLLSPTLGLWVSRAFVVHATSWVPQGGCMLYQCSLLCRSLADVRRTSNACGGAISAASVLRRTRKKRYLLHF